MRRVYRVLVKETLAARLFARHKVLGQRWVVSQIDDLKVGWHLVPIQRKKLLDVVVEDDVILKNPSCCQIARQDVVPNVQVRQRQAQLVHVAECAVVGAEHDAQVQRAHSLVQPRDFAFGNGCEAPFVW